MANTKTILVTGAGSGIGSAIAQRLSKNNYPLILLGRNQDKLEEARNSLESPEKHRCISCDIRLPKDIANALEKSKINLLLFSGTSDNINAVADFVDGFICYGSPRNTELIEQLKITTKKVVTADFDIDRKASVSINNEKAACEIAQLAINSEKDHIAILGLRLLDSNLTCRVYDSPNLDVHCSIAHQRLNGYKQAIAAAGAKLHSDRVWNIPESSHHFASIAAKEALTSTPRPNVLLCMSDLIALAALQEINTMGLKVPQDIRVVGFDGIDEALRSTPPLTTVHQNSEEKGIKAAELFINKSSHTEQIPYYIEHGKSC